MVAVTLCLIKTFTFTKMGLYITPNRSNIRQALVTAANSVLVDQSMPFVTLMNKGLID